MKALLEEANKELQVLKVCSVWFSFGWIWVLEKLRDGDRVGQREGDLWSGWAKRR